MSGQTIGAERLQGAEQQYRHCLLCERRCGVDRAGGERGFCQATAEARVYRCRVECGEEIELIPSQLLYLSGCNLRCVFCIGEVDAFDPQRGTILGSQVLADAIAAGLERGARNIQWVGGEPTIHLPAILAAMAGCGRFLPVVWKSNFYGTMEAFALLDGVVDVYVADLKFGNNTCARQIAGVDAYMQIVTRNLCGQLGRGAGGAVPAGNRGETGEEPLRLDGHPGHRQVGRGAAADEGGRRKYGRPVGRPGRRDSASAAGDLPVQGFSPLHGRRSLQFDGHSPAPRRGVSPPRHLQVAGDRGAVAARFRRSWPKT